MELFIDAIEPLAHVNGRKPIAFAIEGICNIIMV